MYDLQRPGAGHHRLDGQSGQAAEQSTPAVSRLTDDNARTQDHSVEIALHESLVAGELCPGEFCRSLAIDTDSGEVDYATYSGRFAGVKQRGNASHMHA